MALHGFSAALRPFGRFHGHVLAQKLFCRFHRLHPQCKDVTDDLNMSQTFYRVHGHSKYCVAINAVRVLVHEHMQAPGLQT